jgi:tetratricopeptide (TPR) repeat protein
LPSIAEKEKIQEAEALHVRALEITEKNFGPDHYRTRRSLANLGYHYLDTGQPAKAEPFFERARAIQEKQLGAEHIDLAQTLTALGTIARETERPVEAETRLRRALEIWGKNSGASPQIKAASLFELGLLCHDQFGRLDQAEKYYREALAIQEEELGPKDEETLKTAKNYLRLLRASGRPKEADETASRFGLK